MSNDLYVLRVRLAWVKGVWREIAIRGDQTLHEFHEAIIESLEWLPDETYSFYMSDDISELEARYAPDQPNKNTQSTRIGSLRLQEEDEFIYIFSEAEQPIANVRVMSIEDPEPGAEYPDVFDERGESPDQPY